jgi:PHB/PHA accumulation regulator DNA-binding domain
VFNGLRGGEKTGKEFIVSDGKPGEDITRSVLTKIIVEQENKEAGTLTQHVSASTHPLPSTGNRKVLTGGIMSAPEVGACVHRSAERKARV